MSKMVDLLKSFQITDGGSSESRLKGVRFMRNEGRPFQFAPFQLTVKINAQVNIHRMI